MDYRKKLVEIIARDFTRGSFSEVLGANAAYLQSATLCPTQSLTVKYVVPTGLCRISARNSIPVLSTGATLALFDDISTYGSILTDKNSRPGVSVLLAAENLIECEAGSEVNIVSNTVKLGKTLGFCDIKMVDADNRLLARGRHIKYLDMGSFWNFISHPSRMSAVLKCYDMFGHYLRDTKFGNRIVHKLVGGVNSQEDVGMVSANSEAGCVINALDMHDITDNSLNQSEVETKQRPIKLNSRKWQNNSMGKIHGGAIALAAEQAEVMRRQDLYDSGGRVTSMEVTYLSPLKGGEVTFDADSSLLSSAAIPSFNKTGGRVYAKDRGAKPHLCAQYTCGWRYIE